MKRYFVESKFAEKLSTFLETREETVAEIKWKIEYIAHIFFRVFAVIRLESQKNTFSQKWN